MCKKGNTSYRAIGWPHYYFSFNDYLVVPANFDILG